ncbi:MAG: rhodanese-related sulfurtransferase [Bacteroidia bacterium]|jgi:rhodanese-related sulfurtransferase
MEIRYSLLVILLVPLVSCGQKNISLDEEVKALYKNTVPIISMVDAEKASSANILDTREPEEFNVSHIPNAWMVDYDNFELASVKSIPKKDTIIVYCSVGYRSERIGEKLQDAGYTHVFNLYGGIFNWKNQDGVVLDASNDTTERVHTYNKSWSRFLKKGEPVY